MSGIVIPPKCFGFKDDPEGRGNCANCDIFRTMCEKETPRIKREEK